MSEAKKAVATKGELVPHEDPVKVTLGLFNRSIRNKPETYRPLPYLTSITKHSVPYDPTRAYTGSQARFIEMVFKTKRKRKAMVQQNANESTGKASGFEVNKKGKNSTMPSTS